MSDTRTPDTGRESTGPLAPATPDAVMAARGVEWKAVPPAAVQPVAPADDTELIEAFTPSPRRRPATPLLIIGALVGLAVLAVIVLSVLNVSDDSTRPVTPGPLTPISVPAPASPQATLPTATPPSVPAPPVEQASPVPPLPPITATAETVVTAPVPQPAAPTDSPVRDRLHELFPRLFPGDGQ